MQTNNSKLPKRFNVSLILILLCAYFVTGSLPAAQAQGVSKTVQDYFVAENGVTVESGPAYMAASVDQNSGPLTFTKPKAGLWSWNKGHFHVIPAMTKVKNFAINVCIPTCGCGVLTHVALLPISSKKFSFTGHFYGNGTFTAANRDSGKTGLNHLHISGCPIVSGGPWSYTATWKNSSQAPTPKVNTGDNLAANFSLESYAPTSSYYSTKVVAP